MTFTFTYRTPDNVIHDDVIVASSREDVYQKLRPRGIKPCNVALAPGLANRLSAFGKRGWSIVFLVALLVIVLIALIGADRRATRALREAQELTTNNQQLATLATPRHQIPDFPADGLEQLPRYFPDDTDQYFARFAQPGEVPVQNTILSVSFGDSLQVLPVPASDDPAWVAELKRILAGMKREALQLRLAGKSDGEISLWLNERQRMEYDYREQIIQRVKRGNLSRAEADNFLRAVNLRPL